MLVTLTEMKDYLGIQPLNTSSDSFLTTQIQIVSDAIELYCRRKFERTDYLQTFFGRDVLEYEQRGITLYQYPVISINSILSKRDILDSGTDVTDYRVNKHYGIILPGTKGFLFTGCYTFDNDFLEIEYTAGYDEIPALIKAVVYNLVGERYTKKNAGIDISFGSDIQQVSIPGTLSISFDYTLQNNERKSQLGVILGSQVNILDSYRSERAIIGECRMIFNEVIP